MTSCISLPGAGCRFYHHGVCVYEEWRNPGWHTSWRCRAVQALEDDFAVFLERAERFQLADEQVRLLWERRWGSVWILPFFCSQFVPAEADGQDCAWQWGDVCLRRLPPCSGRCKRFTCP